MSNHGTIDITNSEELGSPIDAPNATTVPRTVCSDRHFVSASVMFSQLFNLKLYISVLRKPLKPQKLLLKFANNYSFEW